MAQFIEGNEKNHQWTNWATGHPKMLNLKNLKKLKKITVFIVLFRQMKTITSRTISQCPKSIQFRNLSLFS